MPERKNIAVEWKADADGSFRARFAVFNEVDLDGDVTLPGAFTAGAPVRIAQWGHNWGALPVGKGFLGTDDAKAWADASFFLNTTHGLDTYKTVKELGDLQEWSYGFDVLESDFGQFEGKDVRFLRKLKVHEVSPVMLGAGSNTGTESIKGFSTLTEDATHVVGLCEAFLTRVKAVSTRREKDGRVLSSANRDRLQSHLVTLREMASDIEKLLEDTGPKAAPDLLREFARWQGMEARLVGVSLS